ncbi:hypothetical protein PFISCL1PPCAC_8163, partial [Pristionchus fissidentatus]
ETPENAVAKVEEISDEKEPVFVKKFRLAKGVVGGVQVEACLDTGAEVNLIDLNTVSKMKGVEMKHCVQYGVEDAQGVKIKTVGTIVVDLEMDVGEKCRAGFFVTESNIPSILLGNSALEAMGLELRAKVVEAPDPRTVDDAIVLRTKSVAPGEMANILVGGGQPGQGPKVLCTESDCVVEGVNTGSLIVRVPVWNNSDSDMCFKKHDVIGCWNKVDSGIEESEGVSVETHSERVNRRGDEERKRQMLEDLEEKEKIDQWIVDQGKDQWVLEMLQKLNEVKMGKRDLGEDVVVSGTNKKTCLADWTVSDGILYLLGEDHEQKLYIPEGRRDRFIQEIHDSPLSGHLSIKKLVQKLSQEVFWGTMLKDVQRVVRGYIDNYKRRLNWMMEKTRTIVVSRLENERRKMKAIYDENSKNNRGKVPVVGDRVYVKMEPKQGDLKKMVWQFEGPYRVVGRSDTTVTVVKVGNGFEDDGSSDKKVVQWNRVRLVPKESSETEMGTVNTVGASQELTDDQVHCRVTIDTSSILHPDAECATCGTRQLKEVASSAGQEASSAGQEGVLTFKTLRRLAATLDSVRETEQFYPVQVVQNIQKRIEESGISHKAWVRAYREGMCFHRANELQKIDGKKIAILNEPERVNDAITEALSKGSVGKKSMVMYIPKNSVAHHLEGGWTNFTVDQYETCESLIEILDTQVGQRNLPKSMVVITPIAATKEELKKVKETISEISLLEGITILWTSDFLPKRVDLQRELELLESQKVLTSLSVK